MMNELQQSELLAGLFAQLVPEAILVALACLLFVGGTIRADRTLWAVVTLVGLMFAGLPLLRPDQNSDLAHVFSSPLIFDSLTNTIRWIALGMGVVLTLLGWSEVGDRQAADFFACLVLCVAGTSLTAAANDLVPMFLALELVSIPTYVLLYLPRHDVQAQEAALKYFMLSIFSSALLLFGFSYLYGICGTTNLAVLQQTLSESRHLPVLCQAALVMVVAGQGFRITAVPFHFYAPDVYQGTSTVAAGFLAVLPKVVGFAALIRILGFVLPPGVSARNGQVGIGLSDNVPVLFWFLAVAAMFLGNVMGLLQSNVKRLLGYSSVAHAGYMLMTLASAPFLRQAGTGLNGTSALLFYLVAYGAMTIGVFAVLSYLDAPDRPMETIDDLAGLGTSRPGVAFMMAVFLFSLIGIPLTAGFAGKFLIFFGAMAVSRPEYAAPENMDKLITLYRVLALLGVLNAAIGAWYYLRILAVMYLRQPLQPIVQSRSRPGLATLWVCVLLTIGFGTWPGAGWLMNAAQQAADAKK